MGRQHEPAANGVSHSDTEGRILQFRRRASANRATDSPITDPVRRFEEEEDRRRMQQNLAAAAVIIVVIVAGFWLIDHLRTSARIAACVEAATAIACRSTSIRWDAERCGGMNLPWRGGEGRTCTTPLRRGSTSSLLG